MKKIALFFVVAIFAVACSNAPEGTKTETAEAQTVAQEATAPGLQLNVANSQITWVGTKPTGQHTGTLKFKQGNLVVENGELTGGKLVADMASIDVTDLEAGSEMYTKLVGHLKSPDFFDAPAFPEGIFEITSVKKLPSAEKSGELSLSHEITGNLTLKGISKSITFKAQVVASEAKVEAKTGQIVVDRTEWGIQYKSKKFFSELKDQFIHDEFGFAIQLEASK